MAFFESLLNLLTILFKSLGNFAKINPCTAFFDEPDVPEELKANK
ncbi:cyclic lactone autoinducer peptide [Staphylococcus hyicus]|uniref:Cyclic lactone autoinducer peptide AgrD n=2 Tax=Staphylococcus hyicus TaxID=1284 RepID=A0ACD5FP60_STAHY|nr:cyclic lactone autoinducer peptide [Staphylococcus hyicus]MCQ9292047.1 cyclic lactone autoinducer peptide [Staphylococcus hyicus]MCQ9301635.1 cyclic lactone autoinducer peptide [Staphylococcus hyicus]MCQ9307288.1 cyclic lactone autoinducer peptide [Staphylococcus hyicus]MCQ9309701.1 cyclic lactone autoinducer peptide [Staphylococcus hyicus]MCQ9312122.1 cyclic lactone autoinducer peptide [Staphylococcus hyicus]